jgi:hypothetical protein
MKASGAALARRWQETFRIWISIPKLGGHRRAAPLARLIL